MKSAVAQSILLFLTPFAMALPTGGASSDVTTQGYTAPGSTCKVFRGQMICARDEATPEGEGTVSTQGYTAPGSTCKVFRGQMICARDEVAPEGTVTTQGYTAPGSTCKVFRGQMICS
ncbi:hypothetical protein C8A01DRAFT_14661 [Parachaetomium inaequale]|uniref:Uncharacterized protein n=1 Tax=Parachaetomium inaequale TaxID=2588326 RepID=A0AAN6SSL6_9PEZI|nr:hypothetical protein C8A01DRAFT_14661 [Parachaetomium inaequale]